MATTPLKLDNIQGNILAGFNKDHQSFLFINFPAGSNPKGWLAQIIPDVASTAEVAAFNSLFKQASARRGNEHTLKSSWMNLALSASGLQQLEIPQPELESFPAAFKAGMSARAGEIGDAGTSAPEHWIKPFGSTEIHAVILLAADDPEDLNAEALRHIEGLGDHDLRLLFKQDGNARPDLPGHEHFGFKDGVSQPGIRELTTPENPNEPNQGQPGQDLIWPGEFVLGYPGQKGPVSPPAPISGPPYNPAPTPPSITTSEASVEPGEVTQSGPAWTVDGSYLVFRRLSQDVAGFDAFVRQAAGEDQVAESLIGAKLVGRYKSGCPLERTKDEDPALDTQIADPSIANPSLLEENKINDFEYGNDPAGNLVPRASHIRKVYPRDEATPGGGEADTQTHRIIRRGIAYGAPYEPGAPNGTRRAGDAQFPNDRGLLFLCYQHSLETQFEFLQKFWVNNPNFPEAGNGQDPIIAQEAEPRSFSTPELQHTPLTIKQFVTTTGGEYFFSPSIPALEQLAGA